MSKNLNKPLVSCLMVTQPGRERHAANAREAFEKQTYRPIELIEIMQPVEDPPSLGALRQRSVESARGEYVCQWDDDDRHAQDRISVMASFLESESAMAAFLGRVTLRCFCGYEVVSEERVWEQTIFARKKVFENVSYKDVGRGEDTALVRDMFLRGDKLISIDRPDLYVYEAHPGNTWPPEHFDEHFRKAGSDHRVSDCFKKLRAKASLNVLGRTSSPEFLFLQTNQRCNLKCTHCDFWKLDDDDRSAYLSRERKLELIEEFKQIGGKTVVTCGGEPMLDFSDYFWLTKTVRDHGLKMFSVINGTRVPTMTTALRMMDEGPTEVTVSLNSHWPEEHDRTRGVKGSFDVAVKALRLMLEARRIRGSSNKIYAMTVVHEHNYRELDAFYDFVLNDLGADKLKLNIMQPSFGIQGLYDEFFSTELVQDPRDLANVIRACDKKYGLRINPDWIDQVEMYFESVKKGGCVSMGWHSPIGTKEHICNTYERNIMVDLWGRARLCFSHEFPEFELKQKGDLRKFWFETSLPAAKAMRSCNRYCGISHSVRRTPATLRV